MLKNLSVPGRSVEANLPCIKIIGVGGAGGNAIDNMLNAGMSGVDFLICNTDAQALLQSRCEQRLQLGEESTKGMGAGCSPDLGREAAEESIDEIRAYLQGAQMVFLAAGMGGGTGTGASPVIAKIAKELDILTVAVITTPFAFEGKQRRQVAEKGVAELEAIVDTLSVINNQNLFCISSDSTRMQEAFQTADEVLASSVRSITDLVTRPGIINRDFADVRSVMEHGGRALISTVEAEGDDRAERAAEAVVLNPLLEKVDIATARKLLIHVVGSKDLKLFEVQEIVDRIGDSVEGEPSVAFGYSLDENLTGRLRVSVVATGIENPDEVRRDAKDAVQEGARDERQIDKAALWYDTHQRSRRREAEEQAENSPEHAPKDALAPCENAAIEREPVSEAAREATSARVANRVNRGSHTKTHLSKAGGNFRSALRENIANASTTETFASVNSPRPRSSGVARGNGRTLGEGVEANSNANSAAGGGKVERNVGVAHNVNVGVAHNVFEAFKNFMGMRGAEVPSSRPLYLPREGGETGDLPLETVREAATSHGHVEEKPVGLPAFLQRQRD